MTARSMPHNTDLPGQAYDDSFAEDKSHGFFCIYDDEVFPVGTEFQELILGN